ncbi:unnamed protein product [Linum tenue]|uniref:Uncharacterized protein n=1 Tax=Linum tenue TaxID=586396 RepID=A0AAV0KD79_9ROSI|nr:unnamed protein product [Linum tenue]
MITRSKLVEQLFEDYRIRARHRCPALTIFSPKPHLVSWADVAVALVWALVFSMLVILSCLAIHFRHFWVSAIEICLATLLLLRLQSSRQALAKKRDRGLPLSM